MKNLDERFSKKKSLVIRIVCLKQIIPWRAKIIEYGIVLLH